MYLLSYLIRSPAHLDSSILVTPTTTTTTATTTASDSDSATATTTAAADDTASTTASTTAAASDTITDIIKDSTPTLNSSSNDTLSMDTDKHRNSTINIVDKSDNKLHRWWMKIQKNRL